MAKRYTPIDARTLFCEGMTLTASDVVAESGTDVVHKIGKGRHDMSLVVDISALKISVNDELYYFILQGCDSEGFASGVENLAIIEVGPTEVRLGGAQDSVVGRYVASVSNDLLAEYDYVRLNVIIDSGATSPSITFDAWLSVPMVP